MYLVVLDESVRSRFSERTPGTEPDLVEILDIEDLALHLVARWRSFICMRGRERRASGTIVGIGSCSAHREAVAEHLGFACDDFLAAATDLGTYNFGSAAERDPPECHHGIFTVSKFLYDTEQTCGVDSDE
ncbi:hypothetical protein [Streptomyces sp. NPDC056304]|uniref:hypothetical protein n=1 Tax=Streptomyces sp. NPDC056304 TaxID=3345778 RepID=UPI0035D8F788